MCKIYCFDKLAELSKKHQLKCMIENNCSDMFGNPLNKLEILDFINNTDCCANCNRLQNQRD